MAIFSTQVIRIAADTTSKGNIVDLNTSAEPEAWWARNLAIQVAVFAGATLLDVSDLQSVTVQLKDPSNLDGTALVTKTINSFDNTTTLQTWETGAQQHFAITFSADDLSFPLTNTIGGSSAQRLVHLSMVAITSGGQTGTICVGSVNIIDDGGNSPSSNPVNAITVSQAQAMLTALVFSNPALAISAAGTSAMTYGQSWLSGRQPVTLGAGAGAYVASIVLPDTTALPGALARVIIDFPASANPTLNIHDQSASGTLLEGPLTNPNPSGAASFLFIGGFDGTAWHKELGIWVP